MYLIIFYLIRIYLNVYEGFGILVLLNFFKDIYLFIVNFK